MCSSCFPSPRRSLGHGLLALSVPENLGASHRGCREQWRGTRGFSAPRGRGVLAGGALEGASLAATPQRAAARGSCRGAPTQARPGAPQQPPGSRFPSPTRGDSFSRPPPPWEEPHIFPRMMCELRSLQPTCWLKLEADEHDASAETPLGAARSTAAWGPCGASWAQPPQAPVAARVGWGQRQEHPMGCWTAGVTPAPGFPRQEVACSFPSRFLPPLPHSGALPRWFSL